MCSFVVLWPDSRNGSDSRSDCSSCNSAFTLSLIVTCSWMVFHRMRLIVWLLGLSVGFSVDGAHVSIITLVIGQNPMYGYYASAPAFDVAFEIVGRQYPDMFRNISEAIVYRQEPISGCVDTGDMMFLMAARVYKLIEDSTGFTVILSPGCSLEIITLGDFARELKVPLLTTTSGDASLANRQRYPTLTTFSPAGQGLTAMAVRQFLRRNRWRTVTVLCDSLSLFPSAATVYIIACRSFQQLLLEKLGEFQMYYQAYDSKDLPDYGHLLRMASLQSRIILIATNANFFREIMVVAHQMGMTGGDYAFLYAEAMSVPQTSTLKLRENDGLDEAILAEAFRCVIMFRFPFPNWEALTSFTDAVRDRAKTPPFNYTMTDDEYRNDVSLAGYEAVLVLAKTLNQTWDRLGTITASEFSDLIANRTHELGFQTVNIGANGMRFRDTWITMFSEVTDDFEIIWTHQWDINKIVVNRTFDWFGTGTLPPDVPHCGFRNEACPPPRSIEEILVMVLPPVIIVFALLCFLTTVLGIGYNRLRRIRNSTWWHLDVNRLQTFHNTGSSKRMLSGGLSQASQFSNSEKVAGTMSYDNEKIWMQEKPIKTSLHHLKGNKLFRNTVAEVRLLSHESIGLFMGVLIFANSVALVWELGRGSVRSLLDENKIRLDRPLQLSMILEVLNGLRYIHSSRLGYHGGLSTSCVMLDSRFAIKICNHASSRIFRFMGAQDINQEMPVNVTANFLWMAPEQITSPHHEGSRAADVYSFGLTALEILTSATPFDVSQDDPISVSIALTKLKDPDAPRFDFARWLFPVGMLSIIQSCLHSDERVRPTVQEVLRVWKQFDPHTNIMSHFFARLQVYSVELEGLISARTDELMAETEKVDLLLREIIPSIYVSSLRNKLEIPVEKYERATILFSSLVGFEKFCMLSSPLAVVTLLNKIYGAFDPVIQQYDVYTVETTRDGYLIASGLPVRNNDKHVTEIASFALDLMRTSSATTLLRINDDLTLQSRIGFHTGPCAAGVVGVRGIRYCLFGDTINMASRMESTGVALKIQISKDTMTLLKAVAANFTIESRGFVEIKGKGSQETFFLSSAE